MRIFRNIASGTVCPDAQKAGCRLRVSKVGECDMGNWVDSGLFMQLIHRESTQLPGAEFSMRVLSEIGDEKRAKIRIAKCVRIGFF